jgi:hypothetical protein
MTVMTQLPTNVVIMLVAMPTGLRYGSSLHYSNNPRNDMQPTKGKYSTIN